MPEEIKVKTPPEIQPSPAEPSKPSTPAPAPASPSPEPVDPAKAASEKATAAMRSILDRKPSGQKPGDKPAAENETEEAEKIIRANPKAWRVYEGYKKSTAQKIADYEKRIAELNNKPAPTAADDAKVKELEKRLAETEGETKSAKQRLAELDFSKSDEFKQKYIEPWQKTWKEAVELVTSLQVLDENGEPARAGTGSDFDSIRKLPVQLRRAEAARMFGDAGPEVVDLIRDMQRMEKSGHEAIEAQSKNFETIQAERQKKASEESRQFGDYRTAAQRQLETDFPEYFSADHYKDSPELQQHLKDGYEFVDSASERQSSMTPDERAATTAVIRSRAAAFPLMWARQQAGDAKIAELEKELEQFRGSDPGKGAIKPTGGKAPEFTGGIEEATKIFDE